jgi:hypothetical protein
MTVVICVMRQKRRDSPLRALAAKKQPLVDVGAGSQEPGVPQAAIAAISGSIRTTSSGAIEGRPPGMAKRWHAYLAVRGTYATTAGLNSQPKQSGAQFAESA